MFYMVAEAAFGGREWVWMMKREGGAWLFERAEVEVMMMISFFIESHS